MIPILRAPPPSASTRVKVALSELCEVGEKFGGLVDVLHVDDVYVGRGKRVLVGAAKAGTKQSKDALKVCKSVALIFTTHSLMPTDTFVMAKTGTKCSSSSPGP